MTDHHGIKFTESLTGTRAMTPAATAIIGIVAVGDEADGDLFPFNRPALITNPRSAIGKAGATGTLVKALSAIVDQCTAPVIVVRVRGGTGASAGEDATEAEIEAAIAAETEANIIGGVTEANELTGLKALLVAQSVTGFKPRIIGVPGYDTQAVVAALLPVAKTLRAQVYAKARGETIAAQSAYRANFSDRELCLIWPDFTGWEGDAIARALGLRALIDQAVGWHKSLSNYPVAGVTGIDRDVTWDISGENTDAAALNAQQITTLIRNNGFRFWGNETCSDDVRYRFEVAARTNAVLQDTINDNVQWAVDQPLTPGLIKDVLEGINAEFDRLKVSGRIMGAQAYWDDEINSASALSSGKARIRYKFTPVAPLESLGIEPEITDEFYADFAQQLERL
ncbi:MAG: phage tail sheath subtilisin-like domain-containing protein [Asticcacaulis sp.]